MNKEIIILLIITLLTISLFIFVNIKITKNKNEKTTLSIYLLNLKIYQKNIDKKLFNFNKNKSNINIDLLFDQDLNNSLSKLKESSILIKILLEDTIIKKVKIISKISTSNNQTFIAFGVISYTTIALIKRYIDTTFKSVEEEKYEIEIVNDEKSSIEFEIIGKIYIYQALYTMLTNLKIIFKRRNKYE